MKCFFNEHRPLYCFSKRNQTAPVSVQSCNLAMQDHLLPLITDPRFPEDTLFLVFEEDWRLYRAESQAKKDVVCEYLERMYLDPQGVAVGVQQEHAAVGGQGRWSLQNVYTVLDQDASSGPRKPSGAASSSSGGEPVAPPPFP